jgi:uncharacterized protein (TIGR03663 family)
MMQPRLLRLGLLAIAAGALLFWSRGLKERPMHQDEAIGADKFHELWATHKYTYDPFEYHGPTLNYFTLPVVWVSGAKSYIETTEATYRIVTVLFGVGLILLLRLTWDGLGWAESLCAAALIAISPAMSFYARYYIHEMLLVFFIFLAIASGWRYSQSRKKRWAHLCGIGLGLAYATKETWVLSLVAMGVGIGLALLWTNVVDARVPETRPLLRWKVLLGAAVVGLVVAAILFSGLFTNMRGPIDAVRTYSTYLHRSTGEGAAGMHDKEFFYYLKLLLFYQYPDGGKWDSLRRLFALRSGNRSPIHSEALIVFLAIVGGARALWPSMEAGLGRAVFLRFLAFYTVVLMLIYSAIPYKTPWCLLGFLHGMILLAGVGGVTIVRMMPHVSLRYIVAGLLFMPAGNLAYQAWRINYKYYADQRFNPYLYATPVSDVMRLVNRIRDVAQVSPSRKAVSIKVVTADCWPLPWYLRDFENVWYYAGSQNARPETAYIVIGSADDAHLENVLSEGWVGESFGLRRQVILSVYIEKKLWKAYVDRK